MNRLEAFNVPWHSVCANAMPPIGEGTKIQKKILIGRLKEMKENDITFWQVVMLADRRHKHYSYALKTFCDEQKALRWGNRHCKDVEFALLKISTFKNGSIHCEVVKQGV